MLKPVLSACKAVEGANQGDLLEDVQTYFDDPPEPLETHVDHDKGHGRIEERTARVSTNVAWLARDKFPQIALIACIESKVMKGAQITRERRFYISSRHMTPEQTLAAVRAHWHIENALHWVLDVTFKDDLSRVRKGHSAKNMAVVRHFAINLVRGRKRQAIPQSPTKTRRMEHRLSKVAPR